METIEEIAHFVKTGDEAGVSDLSKRILVVDDSVTMRDMVKFALENAGYDVHLAVDGNDAVEVLDDTTFDLVITDINMPKMDGIDLTRHIRDDARMSSLPVLCLTTERGETTKTAAKAAGATGWIAKPFDPDKLLQVVKKVCL